MVCRWGKGGAAANSAGLKARSAPALPSAGQVCREGAARESLRASRGGARPKTSRPGGARGARRQERASREALGARSKLNGYVLTRPRGGIKRKNSAGLCRQTRSSGSPTSFVRQTPVRTPFSCSAPRPASKTSFELQTRTRGTQPGQFPARVPRTRLEKGRHARLENRIKWRTKYV